MSGTTVADLIERMDDHCRKLREAVRQRPKSMTPENPHEKKPRGSISNLLQRTPMTTDIKSEIAEYQSPVYYVVQRDPNRKEVARIHWVISGGGPQEDEYLEYLYLYTNDMFVARDARADHDIDDDRPVRVEYVDGELLIVGAAD